MSGAEYECSLTEASIKRAQEELNEDPKNRAGAVQAFRDWILKQPHLRCPTDEVFLLKFLRARKFSQLEARSLLERYWTRKDDRPIWLKNLDTEDKEVQTFLDGGIHLVMPKKDKEGRAVICTRFGQLDPSHKRFSKHAFQRVFAIITEYLSMDENTQVNGITVIADFTGFTLKQQLIYTMDEHMSFAKAFFKHFPMRIKNIVMYNMGLFGDFAKMLTSLCLSAKLQERVSFHNSLDTLYNVVPMEVLPTEYLPDDYEGDSFGSVQDVTDHMKKVLTENKTRKTIMDLTSDKYGLDEKKRPTEIEPKEFYRKLNVD